MLTNRVKWHSRWSLMMCVTFMAFMIFSVFLSAGCSSKETTTNGKDQTPNSDSLTSGKDQTLNSDSLTNGKDQTLNSDSLTNGKDQTPNLPDLACPTGNVRLAGASKKTTDTCMLDTDGDGTPDSIDDDDDNDDIPDLTDIDDDGDGLIEIDTLEKLHNIRYNSAGTSYKIATDGANDAGDSTGCGGIGVVAACDGYELTQDLSFDKDGDGETWSGDDSSDYTLDGGDNASPYFIVADGGWDPIASFNAIFEGNGHTITGLAIHRNKELTGMFGIIEADADIRNISLVDSLVYCISMSSSTIAGGLVGRQNGGSITDSYAKSDINGGTGNDFIGGLVGRQTGGIITDSYATGAVDGGDGNDITGGLVGRQNGGSITGSYSTGAVDGGDGNDITGGLVGKFSGGSITGSYSTGDVDGGDGTNNAGGLVGRQNGGSITDSYAIGAVDGGDGADNAGGLVGFQIGGIITGSYATGNVDGGDGTGTNLIGGLVGSRAGGSIAGSYATGDVYGGAGSDLAGGLVGLQANGIIAGSYTIGAVNGGAGSDFAGGLVGLQGGGSIAASYAIGAVDGGDGNDFVGGLLGSQIGGSIAESYGFGTAMGEMDSGYGTSIPSSIGSAGTAMERAAKLTSTNAGMLWNDMNKNTLGAWDFGTDSQIPALRYADYDGGDGTSNDHTIYYCDPFEAGNMIPTPPNASPPIPIPNCGTLIPGQR